MWKVQDIGTGHAIDVTSDGNTTWVRQGKSCLINCGPAYDVGIIPDDAQGIVGRDGNTIYQLTERPKLNDADLQEVSVVFISEQEGKAILAQLDGGETPDTEDTDPVPPEGGSTDDLMTWAQLTAKVKALEASNARLEEELQAAKILLGVAE